MAGLAAAELSGSLGPTPAAADTTDTRFIATGGTNYGILVGAKTTTDYNYTTGGWFWAQTYGVDARAIDASGNLGSGVAVSGQSGSGYGVYGHSGSGIGVGGYSDAGYGVQGGGSVGGYFDGFSAAILLISSNYSGAPIYGSHHKGEISVSLNGVPYICTAGDGTNVGAWQAIGNLRSFADPRRVYANGNVPAGTTVGPIDATMKTDGTASGVPAGAVAAYCAVQSYKSGVMTLFPDGAPDPGIANWTGVGTSGVLNLLYLLVPLSAAGKFKFHIYFTGSVYIDVWGYML